MKKLLGSIIQLLTILLVCNSLYGQVAVSADGSQPDASAMLDVKSTQRGLLVPRMTIAQRNAIATPANGLLVFCTDNNQYYTNKGTPAAPNWTMVSSQWITSGNNIYYTSGNVGVGTSAPLQKLQVSGKIAADYGSSASATMVFGTGDENTGFASPDAFSVGVLTNGVERMRVSPSGHIGIGELNPGFPLTFASALGDKISLYGTAGNHYGFGVQGNQLQVHGDGANSDILFGYGTSAAMTENMRVKGNGRVLIGTTTAPSKQKLYVVSSEVDSSGLKADGIRALVNGPGTASADAIAVHGIASTGATTGIGGQFEGAAYGLRALCVNNGTGGAGNGVGLYASATGSAGNLTALNAYASGNKLKVTGIQADAYGENAAPEVTGMELNAGNATTNVTGILLNVNDGGNVVTETGLKMNMIGYQNNKVKKGIDVAMTTTGDGYSMSGVCYGVATDIHSNRDYAYGARNYAEVHAQGVIGGWTAYGTYSKAFNGNYATNPSSRAYAVFGDIPILGFPNLGTHYAGYFNGDIGGVGIFSYVSDGKFKENIQPITGALDLIRRMKPSSYTFDRTQYPQMNFAPGTRYGFIAQELEEVLPQLVKRDIFPEHYNDKGEIDHQAVEYKGVAYLEIIPVLTAGIREQQQVIERQEALIAAQQKALEDLTRRIGILESKSK